MPFTFFCPGDRHVLRRPLSHHRSISFFFPRLRETPLRFLFVIYHVLIAASPLICGSARSFTSLSLFFLPPALVTHISSSCLFPFSLLLSRLLLSFPALRSCPLGPQHVLLRRFSSAAFFFLLFCGPFPRSAQPDFFFSVVIERNGFFSLWGPDLSSNR